MSTEAAQLVGAIRLLPTLDTIGIAIFMARGGNTVYVGETDARLRITDFIELANEADFHFDYSLPREAINRPYAIGDAAPIPVWIDEVCRLISIDTPAEKLQELLSAVTPAGKMCAEDAADILKHARDGTFERAAYEQKFSTFRESFRDLFEAPPVHSKYWVSRLGVAATAAQRLEGSLKDIATQRLRARVLGWVQWFGSKAKVSLLAALMAASEGKVLATRDVRGVWAAVIRHKIAILDWAFIASKAAAQIVSERLPGGVFDQEMSPVEFQRLRALPDPTGWFIENFRLLERNGQWEQAWRLAFLAYGSRDLPYEITQRLTVLRNSKLDRLVGLVRDDLRTVFSDSREYWRWSGIAASHLRENEEIILISRILNGEIRDPTKRLTHQPGLWASVLADLQRYVGEGGKEPEPVQTDYITKDVTEWLEEHSVYTVKELEALEEAALGVSVEPFEVTPAPHHGWFIRGWSSTLYLPTEEALNDFKQRVRGVRRKFAGTPMRGPLSPYGES